MGAALRDEASSLNDRNSKYRIVRQLARSRALGSKCDASDAGSTRSRYRSPRRAMSRAERAALLPPLSHPQLRELHTPAHNCDAVRSESQEKRAANATKLNDVSDAGSQRVCTRSVCAKRARGSNMRQNSGFSVGGRQR